MRKGYYAAVRDVQSTVARLTPLLAGGVGSAWFVSTYNGSDTVNDGLSWDRPYKTMAKAIAMAQTGDTIYFRGKITEEIVGSNLKFDIKIIGCLSQHHADQPGSGATAVDYGAAVWQSPAVPAGPLMTVRGRGWQFHNILFDVPTGYAAVKLERNALSGLSEYDASHASIVGCDFRNGLYAIQDDGGCFNVDVVNCTFETLNATASAAAVICTSTSVALPRRWKIRRNYFQSESSTQGNERHIIGAFAGADIRENVLGTARGTGKYVDLTGGSGNVVAENILGGVYDTGDYVGAAGDLWLQNAVAVKAVTAPDGLTLAAPAAP